jgi:large subunit ribosomal protein L4
MSKELKIFDMTGASVGEYALEDNCLEFEKGSQAVHDCVVAILAGERAGTASTKTRSDVRGGGQKPFRQKGLGRARAGSTRSPIWRGGGVIFGPKPRSFAKKVNKKVRKLALKRSFTERINEEAVMVLDKFELQDHKTKNAQKVLDALKIEKSVMLVVDEYNENILRATANLPECIMIKASSLNVYQMLRFNKVIFTKAALDAFVQRIA